MPKLNYPLKKYSKAVEILAERHGFLIKWEPTKGSIVRFELFIPGDIEPTDMWVIHHSHNHKREIWSKDDYRKAAEKMNSTMDEFLDILKDL